MIGNFFLLTKVSNANEMTTPELVVLALIAVAIAGEIAILLASVIKMGLSKNTAKISWWVWALCIFFSAVALAAGILLHTSQAGERNSLWHFGIEMIVASAFAIIVLFVILGFKIANCVRAKKYFTTEKNLCDWYIIRAMIIRRIGKKLYRFYKALPKEAKKKIRDFLSNAYKKLRNAKNFKKSFKKNPNKIFDFLKNKVKEYAKKEFGL